MSTITRLKDEVNITTPVFFLLSIITGSIYQFLWFQKNYPVIDRITGRETATPTYLLWMAICFGGSTWVSFIAVELSAEYPASPFPAMLVMVSSLMVIAFMVLQIVWAFRAKSALQHYALVTHKMDLRMNGVCTVLFAFFYINYCINDLPEEKRKQDFLHGRVSAEGSQKPEPHENKELNT